MSLPKPRGPDPELKDYGLRAIVAEAWQGGFTISGDFARRYAPHVAMAASLHFISTEHKPNEFGRMWYVTNKGLRWLKEQFMEDGVDVGTA